ncbi:MAG: hypothetical protein ABI123_08940 [Ginsengibacter sp.]|jgi:hypothetical protein
MKKFILSLLAIMVIGFSYAQDLTADQIVNKYIDAIGGKAAWSKVNSIVMKGTLKVQGAEVNVTMTTLNKKGTKQDISVGGMHGYNIITVDSGWNYFPWQGQKVPEPITADDLKQGQDQLDIQGNLIDYAAKGHTIELLGKDDVDGVEAYKIKETLKSGKVETIYFDPQSFLIIRDVVKMKANGQEVEAKTDLSNYKKLPEGIVIPMSLKLDMGEMTLTEVIVNSNIDPSIFHPSK